MGVDIAKSKSQERMQANNAVLQHIATTQQKGNPAK
jgi:hypothetical protein